MLNHLRFSLRLADSNNIRLRSLFDPFGKESTHALHSVGFDKYQPTMLPFNCRFILVTGNLNAHSAAFRNPCLIFSWRQMPSSVRSPASLFLIRRATCVAPAVFVSDRWSAIAINPELCTSAGKLRTQSSADPISFFASLAATA